jgi:hypothetical protein
MPGENVPDWSTTAASNSSADSSINWAEGQARSTVNDSARSMMAAIAKKRNLENYSITTGGSANAQTITSGVSYTSIPTGLRANVILGFSNTGATTINMDGVGAVAVLDLYGFALTGGELHATSYADFFYNGTNWIFLGPHATASPSFSANMGGGVQTINSGSETKIAFDTEDWDVGGYYDSVTNFRFTPLIRGKYKFDVTLTFAAVADTTTVYAIIYKNGSASKYGTSDTVGFAVDASSSVSTLLSMNGSTDYVEFYALHNHGAARNVTGTATQSYVSGYRVGP